MSAVPEQDEAKPNILPGLGISPFDQSRGRYPFLYRHAIADEVHASQGLTLRERRMMDFISQITDKPDWVNKINDAAIVDKWRKEGLSQQTPDGDVHITEEMFDFVSRSTNATALKCDRRLDVTFDAYAR